MICFHGSDLVVKIPDIQHSFHHLDFGRGFYVTSVKEQAKRWAKRKALLNNESKGIVSIYEFKENNRFKIKDFAEDLDTWIDFVCECRSGSDISTNYDVIKGKVADDKVFRVVDMYRRGIWDKQRAIQEIKVYDSYNQIAFISQEAIDDMLFFQDFFEV